MGTTSMQTRAFKTCPYCGYHWPTRNQLLEDQAVQLVGYQVNFEELTAGLFLFNHACGTTFALPAHTMRDLYQGQVFETRATGTDDCPQYCLHEQDLRQCPAKCECAFVREILQIVRNWPSRMR